jgi:arsenate reductase
MFQVLHNPRCGKSRNCLAFLNDSIVSFKVINYLENSLTKKEIEILIHKLSIKPLDLVRQKESIWIEKFKGKNLNDDDIINALAQYPILIERPIVIKGNKAIIGRVIQNVAGFI